MTKKFEQGLPEELIRCYSKRHCAVSEWEGYKIWIIDLFDGNMIVTVAREKPPINKYLETDENGSLVPKLIRCGDPPFERDVRVDLVVSVGQLYIGKDDAHYLPVMNKNDEEDDEEDDENG